MLTGTSSWAVGPVRATRLLALSFIVLYGIMHSLTAFTHTTYRNSIKTPYPRLWFTLPSTPEHKANQIHKNHDGTLPTPPTTILSSHTRHDCDHKTQHSLPLTSHPQTTSLSCMLHVVTPSCSGANRLFFSRFGLSCKVWTSTLAFLCGCILHPKRTLHVSHIGARSVAMPCYSHQMLSRCVQTTLYWMSKHSALKFQYLLSLHTHTYLLT